MPDILLFLIGLAVTAAVITAFALLIYAEIQDGKTPDDVDAERRSVVT